MGSFMFWMLDPWLELFQGLTGAGGLLNVGFEYGHQEADLTGGGGH